MASRVQRPRLAPTSRICLGAKPSRLSKSKKGSRPSLGRGPSWMRTRRKPSFPKVEWMRRFISKRLAYPAAEAEARAKGAGEVQEGKPDGVKQFSQEESFARFAQASRIPLHPALLCDPVRCSIDLPKVLSIAD